MKTNGIVTAGAFDGVGAKNKGRNYLIHFSFYPVEGVKVECNLWGGLMMCIVEKC